MIKVRHVNKRFDKKAALLDVSCNVSKGSIYGLIGSNGSGKTTLLRIISGVFFEDDGHVTIEGERVKENVSIKSKILFLSDDPYRFFEATANKMAYMYSVCYPRWDQEYFEKLCKVLKIDLKQKLSSQSKGMQRHVIFALSLAAKPDYLILDEPFDGLDAVMRSILKKLIAGQVAEREMTVLISSHNLRELEDLCDTVGFMHEGKVLLEKDLSELKCNIFRVKVNFRKEMSVEELNMPGIVSFEKNGQYVTMVVKGSKEEIMESLDAFEPHFVDMIDLSLEEVFISEMEANGYDYHIVLT